MRTITIRVPRPLLGWAAESVFVGDAVADLPDDAPVGLYVLLRRIKEKAARAERGELRVPALPFEFTVEGARTLLDYLSDDAVIAKYGLLWAVRDHLRDALDDYEEAERARERFTRLRERAEAPADPVRGRWGVGEEDPRDDG